MFSFLSFNLSPSENLPTPPAEESECRLQLVKLECLVSEGFVSADAIYFKVDFGYGVEEWPSSRIRMTSGDSRSLSGTNSIVIDNRVSFNMWDDDTWDADDNLGTASISCLDKGAGQKYIEFTQDGAHYKLFYKVF